MLSNQILRYRYKIVRLLGSGSFGVTYLAEDLDLPDHPLCVVKNLKQSQNLEDLQLARTLFDREAKVLYSLGNESSQIPRLFAHFEENGEFYLVQEFVDGHDLSHEIFPGKTLSEAEVTQLLKEILEILTFVHDKNIIHRDIKTHNLMRRNTDGKIVLIDFGAVKQISTLGVNSQGQTNASVIVGTSGYMPSEQLNGYPKLSSDVYAVGMLGIYALTGIRPQELPRDSETFEIIWRNWASVSSRLADVLDKMVRYHFHERYQTAAEALEALTLPPSSPSPSPSLPTFRSQQLGVNQKVLIGAGVGVGVILGVGLLFMSFWKSPTPDYPVQATPDYSGLASPSLKPSATESGLASPSLKPSETDSGLASPGSEPTVQLVCPETPVPPVPSTGGRKYGTTTYYGFPKNSSITGKGIVVLPDQSDKSGRSARYDGELKNGKFSGCGTYTFANGIRYIGQFDDAKFQGTGKWIDPHGCQYVGEFKSNKADGQGVFISKDGSRYSGTWRLGILEGKNKSFAVCQ
ncbi:MAG: protein kinase [Stigonema ocellatum SAG 48.90 = DSM 106950]|nr:protein kinase [Stigonema ocellatum SAG 48.90 = DSM 106950]